MSKDEWKSVFTEEIEGRELEIKKNSQGYYKSITTLREDEKINTQGVSETPGTYVLPVAPRCAGDLIEFESESLEKLYNDLISVDVGLSSENARGIISKLSK